MLIQSPGSGCDKSQSPSEMLYFALVISFTNCFTFVAAANCCSSIKCAGKKKCPNLRTCAPITFYRWVCQSTSTTKGSTKLRTPKSSCKGNCRPHWVYVSLTVCASWMLKWNMGYYGNIIENLPFPFSCLSSTKTSWRSKGITNLKHTTSALMSGCLYGKYTNDTQILQEAKGRSKILHDDFMFLYLTKPGVSIFSSTRWTSWCGPQCLSLLKCCILRSI